MDSAIDSQYLVLIQLNNSNFLHSVSNTSEVLRSNPITLINPLDYQMLPNKF